MSHPQVPDVNSYFAYLRLL